jgi:hypothetical protein
VDRAWLEVPEEPYFGVTHQEVPEESEVGAAQQEAPDEPNIEDEAGDQPRVTYRLDQF